MGKNLTDNAKSSNPIQLLGFQIPLWSESNCPHWFLPSCRSHNALLSPKASKKATKISAKCDPTAPGSDYEKMGEFMCFQHLSTHSITYFLGSSFHADKTASLQFLEGVFGDSKPMRLMIFMTCIGKSTDCNAIPSHTQYGYCIYHRFILCIYIYIYSFIDLSKHILHIYIYTHL